jgi:hypothetical protein
MIVAAGQDTLTSAIDNSMRINRFACYKGYYLAGTVLASQQGANPDATTRRQRASHTGARDLGLDDLSRPSKQRSECEQLLAFRDCVNGVWHSSDLAYAW